MSDWVRSRWQVLAMGVVLLLLARMPGMMTLMLAVPMLIWSLWGLLRRTRPHPMTVYMLGLLVAAAAWGGQYYRSWSIEQDASVVARAIVQYHARTGHYPAKFDAIGYNAQQLRQQLGLHYWRDREGRPVLIYDSPWTQFDKYGYDFAKKRWLDLGD